MKFRTAKMPVHALCPRSPRTKTTIVMIPADLPCDLSDDWDEYGEINSSDEIECFYQQELSDDESDWSEGIEFGEEMGIQAQMIVEEDTDHEMDLDEETE